jgi:hypothetical protein
MPLLKWKELQKYRDANRPEILWDGDAKIVEINMRMPKEGLK